MSKHYPVIESSDPNDPDKNASFVIIDGEPFKVTDQTDPHTGRPCRGIFYNGVKPVVERPGPGNYDLRDVIVTDDDTSEPELPADFF